MGNTHFALTEGETEGQIAAGIHPACGWWRRRPGAPGLTGAYADFLPIIDAVGHAPAYDVPSAEVGVAVQRPLVTPRGAPGTPP